MKLLVVTDWTWLLATRSRSAAPGRTSAGQRILEQAARGEISHLVTPRTSNLSRNYHDLHQILVGLAEAGVKVITTRGTDEPGAAPELAMRHLAARQ